MNNLCDNLQSENETVQWPLDEILDMSAGNEKGILMAVKRGPSCLVTDTGHYFFYYRSDSETRQGFGDRATLSKAVSVPPKQATCPWRWLQNVDIHLPLWGYASSMLFLSRHMLLQVGTLVSTPSWVTWHLH